MTLILAVLIGLGVGFGFGNTARPSYIHETVVRCTATRPCLIREPQHEIWLDGTGLAVSVAPGFPGIALPEESEE